MRLPHRRLNLLNLCALYLLFISGCSSVNEGTSDAPPYLREEISKNASSTSGITPYFVNGPSGGSVSRLAMRGNTIIAGTESGKIFRLTLDTKTWKRAEIESGGWFTAFADFNGSFFAGTQGGGIFRSSDDGLTWRKVHQGSYVANLVVFHDTLLATTRKGMLRNDLSSESFVEIKSEALSRINGLPPSYMTVLGDQIFVANDRQILRSRDLVDWTRADTGLGLSNSRLFGLTTAENKLFAVISTGGGPDLFSSNNGDAWQNIPLGEKSEVRARYADSRFGTPFLIRSGAARLFVFSSLSGLRKMNGAEWQDLGLPHASSIVHDLVTDGNAVLIATQKGVYTNTNRAWNELNTGLVTGTSPGKLVKSGDFCFSMMNGELFRSSDQGKTWRLVFFDNVTDKPPGINDIAVLGDSIFAATDKGIYRTPISSGNLSAVSRSITAAPNQTQDETSRVLELEVAKDESLYAFVRTKESKAGVFRSKDQGKSWEDIKGLPEMDTSESDDELNGALKVFEQTLFFSDRAVEPSRVFRLRPGSDTFDEVSNGLRQNPVTAFASSGEVVYAAATRTVTRAVEIVPEFFKLNGLETGTDWKPATTSGLSGLTGEVRDLWADPAHPAIIVAGTTNGLFWSNDSGESFNRVKPPSDNPFTDVTAISQAPGPLFINTDAGVFYLHNQIPRVSGPPPWLTLIKDHIWQIVGYGIPLLLLVLLSPRLISLLLKLEVWGINRIAPLFYLTRFGRWKLYRQYRKKLLNKNEIKKSVKYYVDLPYTADRALPNGEASQETNEAPKLSYLFDRLKPSNRIAVVSDGGTGKTTLCAYLAYRCIKERRLYRKKYLQPVVIDGLSYAGNIEATIIEALNNNSAYVNKTIVESQLTAGNLLIIFDGVTEVLESHAPEASSGNLPSLIRNYENTPFIFTSRSELPGPLQESLGDLTTIQLSTIDDQTVELFLRQHLKKEDDLVDENVVKELIRQIQLHDLPCIPLFLKIAIDVYQPTEKPPKHKTELFQRYIEKVLRPDATTIKHPEGLELAIQHLVRETYIRSGGDRAMTLKQAVKLLGQIKDDLGGYDIKHSPMDLLDILTGAGVYRQVRQHFRLFHDSFESYFAACALQVDFDEKQDELLKRSWGNERFKETWEFLFEMISDSHDRERLNNLVKAAEHEFINTPYFRCQRDKSVDYLLWITKNTDHYKVEIEESQKKASFDTIRPDDFANLTNELRAEMKNLALGIQRTEDGARHLRRLATLGNYAFNHFFQSDKSNALSKLDAGTQGSSLQIATDSCFFPWEFVYPASPESELSFQHFWGLNHTISRLVVQDARTQDVSAASTNGKNSKLRIGLLADETLDDSARQEIKFFEEFAANGKLELYRFAPSSSAERQSRIDELRAFFAQPFDLVHIVSNVEYDRETPLNSVISLSRDWHLNLSDLEYSRLNINGQPLVVMNACEAGNLTPQRVSSFAATFLKYGARGVVATESFIPSVSAGRFAVELYTRLFQGQSLGDSLLDVRRLLWSERNPAGLFYSMYAPPSLTLIGTLTETI